MMHAAPICTALEVASGPALHIPDGFLSAPVSIVGWIVTAAVVGVAARRAERTLSDRAVPLMGVMAAFIFAAQMMNFPVAGGTSGHLLGGALAAALLGPWAAIIVMTAVVGLQGLLFQDGGLLVMGANIFNMGIVTAGLSTLLFRAARPFAGHGTGALVVAFAVAWVTVEAAAILTAVQLAVSGTSPIEVALPAMVGVHALIGIGEGLITAAALAFIRATSPNLLPASLAPEGAR
ncbi:MAG: energy-coupling factor ABC transporter permease, partial [Rhodospirillales bacterium]|nr:energy-coupling factor ABC transporter permease [Rhodospirillales bacterium]